MIPGDDDASELRGDALAEFAARWRRARKAARELPGDERERLRRAFENSLRLGEGFVRFNRTQIAPERLPEVLGQLGSPCLLGRWSEVTDEAGYWLERAPCRAGADPGCCDHWREAIGGLVLGLTGGVRHTSPFQCSSRWCGASTPSPSCSWSESSGSGRHALLEQPTPPEQSHR